MAIRTKLLCEVLTEFADGTSRARLVSATQEADDASLYVTGAYVAGTATAIVEMTYASGVAMPFTLGVYYYAMTAERGATGGSWTLKKTTEHGDGWGQAEYAVVPDATKSNWPISGTFSYTYNHGNAYGQVGRPGVAFDIYFVSVSDTSNAVMRGKPAPAAPTGLTGNVTTLGWGAVSGATAYETEIQKSVSGSWVAETAYTAMTGTSKTYPTPLASASSWRTRMRSRDAAGVGAWSGWTEFSTPAAWILRFYTSSNWLYVDVTNNTGVVVSSPTIVFTRATHLLLNTGDYGYGVVSSSGYSITISNVPGTAQSGSVVTAMARTTFPVMYTIVAGDVISATVNGQQATVQCG